MEPITPTPPTPTGFSKEYVEGLRQEAADWRTKYQEMKRAGEVQEISTELALRGIKAEAGWIDRKPGQTAAEAVDGFLVKYPHLLGIADKAPAGTPETITKKIPVIPKVEVGGAPAGKATPAKGHPLEAVRNLDEIMADPKQRAELAANYRDMLRNQSHRAVPE